MKSLQRLFVLIYNTTFLVSYRITIAVIAQGIYKKKDLFDNNWSGLGEGGGFCFSDILLHSSVAYLKLCILVRGHLLLSQT